MDYCVRTYGRDGRNKWIKKERNGMLSNNMCDWSMRFSWQGSYLFKAERTRYRRTLHAGIYTWSPSAVHYSLFFWQLLFSPFAQPLHLNGRNKHSLSPKSAATEESSEILLVCSRSSRGRRISVRYVTFRVEWNKFELDSYYRWGLLLSQFELNRNYGCL